MPESAARHGSVATALALALIVLPGRAAEVGVGRQARPALARVGVPELRDAGELRLSTDLGAGVIEALADGDSAHLRAAASGAAALQAARFLDVGLRFDGRYDRHESDAQGSDDGFLFESELSSRLALQRGALGFGLELAAWLPGGPDIGTSFESVGFDGRALFAVSGRKLVLATSAGYRLDRSAKGALDADRLRLGDRIALGASDSDAVLAGLGLGYALGKESALFGELSAQLLLDAPELSQSPLRLSVGARMPLGNSGLSGEVAVDTSLSSRPDVAPGSPLVPIEPRVMLLVGLRFAPPERPAAPPPPPPPAPKQVAQPARPTAPAAPSVELALVDDRGQALQGATVTLRQGEAETPLEETSPGHYRLGQAQPGKARVRIEADGYKPIERELELGAGKPFQLGVTAEQALPAGQVRGLVRSYAGKALSASIRIEPLAIETKTDAEGFFQIDVPPGEYEVVIEAPGFAAQRRKARVDQQGVVIVNADLSKAP